MADQISLLEKALEVSPDNWPTRRYLIEHFASEGDVRKAGELVKAAPEIPAEEAEKLFAAEILAKAEPQAAQSLLDDILRANAACAQAHVVKAAIHRLAGDREKASSHMKVAAVLSPGLDIEKAIADAVAQPQAPPAELPLEVSQAVQIYTGSIALKADDVEPDGENADAAAIAAPVFEANEAESAAPATNREAEAVPVPLSAVPLRPPGERSASPEAEAAVAAKAGSAYAGNSILPVAAEVSEDVSFAEDGAELGGADRSFIVGDGEMVHARDKAPDTKEKISALTVALLVNVGLIAAASFWAIAGAPPEAPSIVVSSVPDTNPDDLPDQKIVKQQRAAASVQQATPVVTVNAYSEIAVPEITDDVKDMSLVTLGDNTGSIGLSMTGLGDVSNMGSIPAAMRSRCSMSQRMKRLRESGGEERAERAVRNALAFIATKQNKETGAIGTEFPAAMTGLSLLAFLGHCETPESPQFGDVVINAAQYLMRQGKEQDGWIFNGDKSGNHSAYEHAIGTYALAELFTMTKASGREIPQLESVLRKAVKIIVDGQTGDGGWLYGYRGEKDGDYSVSGWQIQALKASYNTGKGFSGVEKALNQAMDYTKKAQDKDGGIRYKLGDPKGKPTLAGAGVLALQMWNHGGEPEAALGLKFISDHFMDPSGNTYGAYYNTQALFLEGGKQWDAYNAKFQKQLLDKQAENGSWVMKAAHGPKGDEAVVYSTALCTLMLEVYYRYLPTTEKLDGLKK